MAPAKKNNELRRMAVGYETPGKVRERAKERKGQKFDAITDDKGLGKYVGGKINKEVDKVGSKVSAGSNKVIDKVGQKIVGAGGDKAIVGYVGDKAKKGVGRMIKRGSGQVKNWIHNDGKKAIKEGAEHVGNKIKEGWGKLKSKFRK